MVKPTLEVEVDGLTYKNPFLLGSGPPGTNARVIAKAFDLGWGGVVAKTISLDSSKVSNVAPRYAKLKARQSKEVIGFENIELISDRPYEIWLEEFRELKKQYPDHRVIASVMEEYNKEAWQRIITEVQETGVDAFELNLSCPHGLPERKMGAAMGQSPEIVKEVTGWVMEVAKIPVWAKMTPNVTDITQPAQAAFDSGVQGVAAINTILSVIGVDLKTLRPQPTVEGHTVPGGYSCQAVRPIALRHVMEIGRKFYGKMSISGIGGIETAADAAQFIALGSSTVQLCTGAMLRGYKIAEELNRELLAYMEEMGFADLTEFRGKALEYFSTHANLVERQKAAKIAKAGERNRDNNWTTDGIQKETDELTTN